MTSGLLFLLFFRWTGNRIASLLGAVLAILHPANGAHWSDPEQISNLLPLPFLLLALLVHLEAQSHWGILKLVTVLIAAGLALSAGSLGFSLPGAMLLLLFYDPALENSTRRGRRLEIAAVVGASLLAAWGLGRFSSMAFDGAGFPAIFARLIAYPAEAPQAPLIGAALFALCALVFAVGATRLHAPRRWLIHFASLASGWFSLMVLQHLLGWVESRTAAVTLGILPFCMVPPVLVWRLLLACFFPEAPPLLAVSVPSTVPPLDRAALTDARRPARVDPLLPHADLLALRQVLGEVREALRSRVSNDSPPAEIAVGAYDAAYRDATGKSCERVAAKRRPSQPPGPWSDPNLSEDLYQVDCRPHLRPSGRVLVVGPCPPWLAQRFLDAGQSMVKVGAQPHDVVNEQVLQFEGERVTSMLSDGANLRGLASGTVDFAIAPEHLLYASHDEVLATMMELHRLLRAGSCAVLVLGNLKDPVGMEQLRLMSAPAGESSHSRRRQFTTPEAVSVLAGEASLSVEAVRLAANNSDMFVVLKREVS